MALRNFKRSVSCQQCRSGKASCPKGIENAKPFEIVTAKTSTKSVSETDLIAGVPLTMDYRGIVFGGATRGQKGKVCYMKAQGHSLRLGSPSSVGSRISPAHGSCLAGEPRTRWLNHVTSFLV